MAWFFRPPRVVERRGSHPLLGRLGIPQGVSILKEAGFYRQVREPSAEDVSSAEVAYTGGRVYPVSPEEALSLIEAGYGEYVTETGRGYGRGLYGIGPYGR